MLFYTRNNYVHYLPTSMKTLILVTCLYITITVRAQEENVLPKPHIVLIVADDLGWNDVSFHGANQIPTPNIDALAYNGVILNRFYTLPTCSPSRAALLTGQYPIRLGLQGYPIIAGQNLHLPLNVSTLPEKLKELGYSTKLVGKWHLGSAYKNVTPTNRGFDYHFGYWNGFIGYFDHEASNNVGMRGLDMHENLVSMWSTRNQYATDLLTSKAKEIIQKHNQSQPLFLTVCHLAPHGGKNGTKLEVPNVEENNITFHYIENESRRLYAGMVTQLDKSVGTIIKALSDKSMLNDSLILFFADNGAPSTATQGSNWPLRGVKYTLLEGGVRNVAILYSSRLNNKNLVSNELVHICDLMPTLYAAAGGNISQLGDIDGINQWPTLAASQKSSRTKILLNIDEVTGSSALIGENGRYKLVNDSTTLKLLHGYFGDDGRSSSNPPYNVTAVLDSITNIALGNSLTHQKLLQLRQEANLGNCRQKFGEHSTLDASNNTSYTATVVLQSITNMVLSNKEHSSCDSNNLCLFDIIDDPCETTNIAAKYPEIVKKLSEELLEYWKQVLPQKEIFIDAKANPIYFNNTWHTWLDV